MAAAVITSDTVSESRFTDRDYAAVVPALTARDAAGRPPVAGAESEAGEPEGEGGHMQRSGVPATSSFL